MDNPQKDTSTQTDAQKDAQKDRKGGRKRGRTVSIKELWFLLWSKRFAILFFFLLVMSITAIYTFKTPWEYKATTRLEIAKETLEVFSSKSIFPVDTTTVDYFNTQCKILGKSRTLAENVIQARRLKVVSRSGEERPMSPAELLAKVAVTPIRDTRLVDVSVIDKDPKEAAQTANALADEFIKFTISKDMGDRNAKAQAIRQELERLALGVKDAEKEFNNFKQKYGVVSDKPEENPVSSTHRALTAEVSQRRKDTIAAEQVYTRLQNLSAEELLQQKDIADDKVVQELQANLLAAENQLGLLSQFYGPKHPKHVAAKDAIEKIKGQITAATLSVRDRLREAWTAAKENEAKVVAELEKAREQAEKNDSILAEYHRYQMDVETKKATYQELLRRGTEGAVESGVARAPTEWEQGTSNIRVIDRAVTPGRPFRPRPVMNMALAAFIGLSLGAGAAFIVVYLSDKVRNPDDITEDLGRRLLAVISNPKDDWQGRHRRHYRRQAVKRLSNPRILATLVHEYPDERVSEGYRDLRTSISLAAGQRHVRSILVTSTEQGEGKTTTATNLAISFAKDGKKVVLVDTDLRRPTIHKYFGIDASKGLVKYLNGESTLDGCLESKGEFAELGKPVKRSDTRYHWLLRDDKMSLRLERWEARSLLLSPIRELRADDVEGLSDAEYGFDQPAYTAEVKEEFKGREGKTRTLKTRTLLVGGKTDGGQRRYAKLSDDNIVLAVPQWRLEKPFKYLSELQESFAHLGGLWILPCGARSVHSSTEVIGSPKMTELIEELKKRFDMVVFDSPPCRFSDPLLLGKMVDAIIVVAEAGKFPKRALEDGLSRLDKVGEDRVLGVVLNKFRPKKSGGYGYYGYRSYHYYYKYYSPYYYYRYEPGPAHHVEDEKAKRAKERLDAAEARVHRIEISRRAKGEDGEWKWEEVPLCLQKIEKDKNCKWEAVSHYGVPGDRTSIRRLIGSIEGLKRRRTRSRRRRRHEEDPTCAGITDEDVRAVFYDKSGRLVRDVLLAKSGDGARGTLFSFDGGKKVFSTREDVLAPLGPSQPNLNTPGTGLLDLNPLKAGEDDIQRVAITLPGGAVELVREGPEAIGAK